MKVAIAQPPSARRFSGETKGTTTTRSGSVEDHSAARPGRGRTRATDQRTRVRPGTIHYEVAERSQAISCGGIGAVHLLASKVGLIKALDTRLPILKRRRPYSEADHILNIVYNTMCGGLVLDDLEVRRNDVAFLDALGARTIPDPTTAGDFCRRFGPAHIDRLMTIVNDIRVGVWQQQAPAFFEQTARIDVDESDYRELVRHADDAFNQRVERAKQPWVKEQIVRERGYLPRPGAV